MASPDDDDMDIESALDAAFDEQAGGEPREEQREAEDDAFPSADKMPARKEYVREGSRFVAKQAEDAAEGDKATKEPKADAQKQEQPDKAPLWFKNEWGEWEKLNPDMRKALSQRERDYAQGIEKHSTAAKAWEPVSEALKPFEQQLRAQGQTPQQFVGGLLNIYDYLQKDPVQALDWLAQNTLGQGWNLRELVRWMDEQQHEGARVDPMQQKVAALEQQVQALQNAPAQQYQEQVRATISEWSKDKPYFGELQSRIMGLIQADPGVRDRFRVDPKATLDSLYDEASWAHPQIRERILADQRQANVKRARDQSFGTRNAGGHANGVAKSSPKLTLEEEIASLIDQGV